MANAELPEDEAEEGELEEFDSSVSGDRRFNEPVVGLTDVKVQHYIPRMYLRGFAGSDGKIRVVDLKTGDAQLRTTVKNVGAESRFNNFRIEDIEVSTEGWLSEVEGIATPLLDRLIQEPGELLAFTLDEQMYFARFLATFRFRVPAFRAEMDALRAHMLGSMKRIARSYLLNQHKDDEAAANRIWEEWEQQPEEWWLQQDRPFHPAELTAQMLADVQGYANMLWSLPWRIGRVPQHLRLYTSDNPLQGYLHPIHPWWEPGGFASMLYYMPLSPSVLLRIAPISYRPKETPVGQPGAREVRAMSGWNAAMAMHIQSSGATRYLYGDGPFLGRDEARKELAEFEMSAITASKFVLNWSGDEPPTIQLPDGREGTPAPVSPLQKVLARRRKQLHER